MYQHEQVNIIKNTEDPMMCNDRRCVMCIRVLRIFGVWSNSHRNNILIIQDIYIYIKDLLAYKFGVDSKKEFHKK